MKRTISILLLLSVVFSIFPASTAFAETETDHEHIWTEANYAEAKTCTICGLTEGEPLNGPVCTPFGFCLSPYTFMYIYDRALKQIEYSDWITGLEKEDGIISFDSKYKIKIGTESKNGSWSSMDWFDIYPYLSFEGNENFLEPLKQITVEFDSADFLLRNYTDTRSWILGFYEALVLSVEPDIDTLDEARKVSNAAFAAACGGADIHNANTRELTKLPAVYKHDGIIYTINIDADTLLMTASVDAIKVLQAGSSGAVVKEVQKRLIELDYLPAGGADGSYGNGTAAAVKEFQKAAGLEENGKVDSLTYRALFQEDAPAKA